MALQRAVKGVIRRAAHRAGFSIERIKPAPTAPALKFGPEDQDKSNWLKNLDIRTVIDVGANTGQFVSEIRSILPHATIYSFEPLKDCYEQLLQENENKQGFRAFNFALGDQDTDALIRRSGFSPATSLLSINDTCRRSFPFVDEGWATERIVIKRLDDIAAELSITDNLLVKIDVQGFEDRVIRGGHRTIQRATLLIVEMTFEPLYSGQPLFDDIYQWLRKCGFVYRGALQQLLSPVDGTPLQADGVFLRTSSANLSSAPSD